MAEKVYNCQHFKWVSWNHYGCKMWEYACKLKGDTCDDVYCDGCDKVRYAVVCNAQRGGCGATCGWRATKEEAITAWNTRTPEKDVNNAP